MYSFKGYMRLYLNADSMEEMLAKSQFFGDWANKRKRILSKKRLYHINLYLRAMDYKWSSRVWSQSHSLHPYSVKLCNIPSRGEKLHLKFTTKGKVDSEQLWIAIREGVGILLDVDTQREEYVQELVDAYVSLMGDNLKTHLLIKEQIDKLPVGMVVIDMDETYATIRC